MDRDKRPDFFAVTHPVDAARIVAFCFEFIQDVLILDSLIDAANNNDQVPFLRELVC